MSIDAAILALAKQRRTFTASDVVRAIEGSYSRVYVARRLKALVDAGALVRRGHTRGAVYALPKYRGALGTEVRRRLRTSNLQEDRVYQELQRQAPFLRALPESVEHIVFYAFSEMLNNAIEHARSETVGVSTAQEGGQLVFEIRDRGIGVFRNVQQERQLDTQLDAIHDLLKGKQTTAPATHSGEGIFFTSRVADLFILESFGYRLRVDNTLPDVFIEPRTPQLRGTRVRFEIDRASSRQLKDVFAQYQTDPTGYGFDTTEIRVKLYTLGIAYLSRSQARRVLAGLEQFKRVILDFDKVSTIGQAFADEVFRVFRRQHPRIEIVPVNMNETVAFMIGRVAAE